MTILLSAAALVTGLALAANGSISSSEHYGPFYAALIVLLLNGIAIGCMYVRASQRSGSKGAKAALLLLFSLSFVGVVFALAQLWLPFALAGGNLPPW